jgi:hypothetical protein
MIRARWQGFDVESGENQAPMLVTHWYVLKQGLVFALFSIPFLSTCGLVMARWFLKPSDWPVIVKDESESP